MNETTSRISQITQECEWAAESGAGGCARRRLCDYFPDQDLAIGFLPRVQIAASSIRACLTGANIPRMILQPGVARNSENTKLANRRLIVDLRPICRGIFQLRGK